jgi:protein-tyrosine phosphatase
MAGWVEMTSPAPAPAPEPDPTRITGPDLIAAAAAAGVPLVDLPSQVNVDRYIGINGTFNFRELGGIGVSNGVIKHDVLFRSDHLNEVTDSGLASIAALGLRQVYDFRLPIERERQPSRLPDDVGVTLLATGDLSAAEAMVAKIPNMLSGVEPIAPASWWDDNYVDLLGRGKEMLVALVAGIAQSDGVPALYHCTGGKDRTGMASMIILHALGASDEDIVDDFLATNVFRTPKRLPFWAPKFAEAGITKAQAMPILGVTRSGIMAALAELNRLGGAQQYLSDGGLTAETLTQLRTNLVG